MRGGGNVEDQDVSYIRFRAVALAEVDEQIDGGSVARIMENIQAARTHNPKTVLAFLATVLGIAVAGSTGAGSAVLLSGKLLWLAPIAFGFAGALVVAVLVVVFIIIWKDPSKLLLTQLSGSEYLSIQREIVLGDSTSGEKRVSVPPSLDNPTLGEPGVDKVESDQND